MNILKCQHILQYFCSQASPEENVVATFNVLENPYFHMPDFSGAGGLMQ